MRESDKNAACTGADNLVAALKSGGVDTYFANPGTSEMQLVSAIDKIEGVQSVLALFEGVATGAADGYARVLNRPAGVLLHLGPGLGNGWANLHNARRAHVPVLNIVGDHAVDHLALDAPLTSDLDGIAQSISHTTVRPADQADLVAAGDRALAAAYQGGGQVSTLIVPSDLAWSAGQNAVPPLAQPTPTYDGVDDQTIDKAITALKGSGRRVIFAGGRALQGAALDQLGQIAQATGAELIAETFTARAERGAGRVPFKKLAYFAEMALDQLTGCEAIITVGTKSPVSFFAYPNVPSNLVPDGCAVISLASPTQDASAAIGALADHLGVAGSGIDQAARICPERPSGDLTADKCWQAMAALLPEGTILSEEAATSSVGLDVHMAGAAPFDHMQTMGGSIGQALPAALGAAIAAPDRKVVCATGDGGAMYTIQSLWSMARENLDVVTIIFANRSYAILNIELMRVGAQNPGPKALDMLDIGRPDMNFTQIARGMGVEAGRAETAAQFATLLDAAMQQKGPFLIEAVI
ncbi:MAG: acetolactate synthase large subunit [Alphaproteobacteria bacterium]